eukprot:CAMPEP_0114518280 /NCGR_PEP_ID=MMETSP0109-20121206/18357_1 /TAXON_ID=29199 /ORGANISM="Chlorarachnion reptans, Strain CCCM449" /LENGTH=122 /DNA_ID=CAMNT_0001698885 /DNA_START=124 /DNA_END=492 /DNA_ORIENTATION=-
MSAMTLSPEEYKAYEDRATYAEEQLKILAKRMSEIERAQESNTTATAGVDPAVSKALQRMKDVMLKGLVALKKTMVKAQDHTKELSKENEKLKIENEKLKYQIFHLKRSLDEAMGVEEKAAS